MGKRKEPSIGQMLTEPAGYGTDLSFPRTPWLSWSSSAIELFLPISSYVQFTSCSKCSQLSLIYPLKTYGNQDSPGLQRKPGTWLQSLQHDPQDPLGARWRQNAGSWKSHKIPFWCTDYCKPLLLYQAATPFTGRNDLLGFVSHAA